MTTPWVTPPFPKEGDRDQNLLFSGVGSVISNWEEIEGDLCHLYCLFSSRPFEKSAIAEYGEPRIFAGRARVVRDAVIRYFRAQPDQALEGDFEVLMSLIESYSGHRNTVAHAIARPFQWIFPGSDMSSDEKGVATFSWCLLPTYYQRRRFVTDNEPDFIFTSKELGSLAEGLRGVLHAMIMFRWRAFHH